MQKVQGLTRNVLVLEEGVDHGEKQRPMARAAGGWLEAAQRHPLVTVGRVVRSGGWWTTQTSDHRIQSPRPCLLKLFGINSSNLVLARS